MRRLRRLPGPPQSSTTLVTEPSARDWLRRLDAGEVSARELTERVLARLDAAAQLNAVAARDDDAALAAADATDAARRCGERRPLLGLPLTVKDSLATAGLATRSGSWARAAHIPTDDATVVARAREAGAVVLAKTTVPEYTWSYETESALTGRTGNPFDAERTCGGSSGGEAALLGADASLVGIGSDGGGSIRVPSHYCGIAGLRPTAGLVPETGCWPPTRDTGMLDMNAVGPMARHVEDLELLLPVLAGQDDVDPYAHGTALAVGEVRRVGFYTDDGVYPVSAVTAQVVRDAAHALEAAGAVVEEARPPDLSAATELFFALMAADGGAQARADTADAQGRHAPQFARLLEDLRPLALDASGFFALARRMFELRASIRAFVSNYDVVLCPVTAGPAPPHGCTPGAETPMESYAAFNYTHAFSVAGLPVAVVRAGAERGLPIGLQVVAGAFADTSALAAAAVLERTCGGFAPPAHDTVAA